LDLLFDADFSNQFHIGFDTIQPVA
jgi:hypothetical protein